MDPLSDVLSILKPVSYGFRGVDAGGDWALAYAAANGIKCFAVTSGECWLAVEHTPAPLRLGPGDPVLLPPSRRAFRLYSTDAPPIDAHAFFSGVPAGETAMINAGGDCAGVGGFFGFRGAHAERLLSSLPPVILVGAQDERSVLRDAIGRLMQELRAPRPATRCSPNTSHRRC